MLDNQTSNETPVRQSEGETHNISQSNRLPVRNTYRVGENPKNLAQVKALSYYEAANIVAGKLYGAQRAERVKGINYFDDMPGYFQCFMVNTNRKAYPIGNPFYLAQVCDTTKTKQLVTAAAA